MPPSDRISFALLTPNNVGSVRKLNSVLFPIKYSDKFYHTIIQPEVEDFCKLVYFNDIPVGTICCRLEGGLGETKLYIMTMGVLAPYRSRGLGSKSLEHVLAAASSRTKHKISHVYLHVQTCNTEAKKFYERHGFRQIGIQEDYYKKILPHEAWILERAFTTDASEPET